MVVNLADPSKKLGHAFGDTYIGIEGIEGSHFADNLTGNNQANHILGHEGADSLKGLSGPDRLIGGLGRDVMEGGPGADTFEIESVGDSVVGRNCGPILGGLSTNNSNASITAQIASIPLLKCRTP